MTIRHILNSLFDAAGVIHKTANYSNKKTLETIAKMKHQLVENALKALDSKRKIKEDNMLREDWLTKEELSSVLDACIKGRLKVHA